MDKEFHYYATGLIAKRSGFSEAEAEIIGHASQFVDENDVALKVRSRSNPDLVYRNYISQTMNILKPKHELLRIYPIFHFIPGDPEAESAWRRDGKMHRLNTTPNSERANQLLDEAFKASEDTRLYRIGIATHAFVDTWAHQNFVGWYDSFNSVDFDIKPTIGHAQAEHHPDWIAHKWQDNRLVSPEVDNSNRFLSAAQALFMKYCSYLKAQGGKDQSGHWDQLQEELMWIFGRKYTGNVLRYREDRMERFLEKIDLDTFNDRDWFDGAIETDVQGLKDSHQGLISKLTLFEDKYFWKEVVNQEETHWFKFQEAVKEHEKLGLKLLRPIFAKMKIDLDRA
ncbi:MAG: DUF6765 family protein [Desulfohalobiaceae bacterium]